MSTGTTTAARSSTAAHYASNFETVSVGLAEHDFYHVVLDNNLVHAPVQQWVTLVVLLVIVHYLFGRALLTTRKTTKTTKTKTRGWIVVIGVTTAVLVLLACYLAPQLTWIPVLTTILYTRTSYPYAVVIPHCLWAHATYRTNHTTTSTSTSTSSQYDDEKEKDASPERQQQPQSQQQQNNNNNNNKGGNLQSLVECFFLYGFGGSIVTDVLLGLPVTAVAHNRIVPCHVLAWVMIWYCPADYIYQQIILHPRRSRRRRNTSTTSTTSTTTTTWLLRTALVAAEAVDAVTTPMGRMARAARELRNKTVAPALAGLLAGVGGTILRGVWLSASSSSSSSSSSLSASSWWEETLQPAVDKTVGYCLVFYIFAVHACEHDWWQQPNDIHHCDAYSGSDLLRVILVLVHVAWTLAVDAGWVASSSSSSGHFFAWMAQWIRRHIVTPIVRMARLGPPPPLPVVVGLSESGAARPKKE